MDKVVEKKIETLNLTFSRFEYKYYIPSFVADDIAHHLKGKTDIDPYNKNNEYYSVSSVYFDTPDLMFFKDKYDGFSRRLKVRMRSYDDNFFNADKYFFEIKFKNVNKIYKERVPISRDAAFYHLDKHFDVVTEPLLEKIRALHDFHSLAPIILVRYKRLSFYDKYINFKISIDKNVQVAPGVDFDNNSSDYIDLFGDYSVLELKFDKELPLYVINLLSKYNLQRDSISKYGFSVLKLYNY
ncbi:polyphosphate polymerase domain-containing protein [Patescibacteria group bacterium]